MRRTRQTGRIEVSSGAFFEQMDSLPVNCRPFVMWRVYSAGFLGILAALLFAACPSAHGATLADNFADRQVLSESETNLSGSNVGATRESGEPQHAGKSGGTSLWVSWIAPTNGIVTFRTAGSDFDTLLAAYYFRDGDAQTLDKLREAASNDDDPGTQPASYIQFATKAGRRYEIAVDGFHGATGDVALAWDFVDINTQPPIVVSVPGDRAVRLGDPVTLTVNFETSPDARLQWRFNGDSFGEEGPTLFIPSLQLTNVGRYSLRVRIGDNRFETTPVEIQINSEGQTNALARDKYFDALDSRLTPSDDDDAPAGFASLIVAASGAPLAANPGVTRGYNGTQVFNTTYATPDPNEPQHCGVVGGASYWFAYEAPTNGVLHVDTIGSGFDTVLAAYGVQQPPTGFESLISLACDNDALAPQGESRIELPVAAGQQYLIVVDGVAGAKGIAHLNYQLEVTDTTSPSVIIAEPLKVTTLVSNALVQLSGTATDNVGVSNVIIQTSRGGLVVATGTNEWSAELELAAGTNVLTVTAMDAAGNVSSPVVRTVVFVVRMPLSLSVVGQGTVSGATNGQWLELGRSYALLAKPAKGYFFRGWTDGATGTVERVTFLMQSNFAVTATFVTNPFGVAAGVFTGIFRDTNQLAIESAGLLSLTLSSGGRFSGAVRQAHRRLPFSGTLDLDGRSSVSVKHRGTNVFVLELGADLEGGQSLTGSISGGSWVLPWSASKAAFHSRTRPATNYSGRYTMLIPGADDTNLAPPGDGWATIVVSASGAATVAGQLADGTAFSCRSAVSGDGHFVLFDSLYRGRGILLGDLALRPEPDAGSDVSGTADWLRPSISGLPGYATGFWLTSTVAGSVYERPGLETMLGLTSGGLVLEASWIPVSQTNQISFGAGSRLASQGPSSMTISASAATGAFRGLADFDGAGGRARFRGIFLQRQQTAGGYLQLADELGRVGFVP